MSHRKMLSFALLLTSVAFAIADDKPKGDAEKEDSRKLQGIWQVTKFVDHSEEAASADEIKHMSIEFKGDDMIVRKDKDDSGKEFQFTLNPSKKPKWIDVDMGGRVSEGIYKLDGDELTLCIVGGTRSGKAAVRPSEFKASNREIHSLFVLRKMKK